MEIGKIYKSTAVVEESHLACNVGRGDLPVFATPMMHALMENATVGGSVCASHIKPTGKGKSVTATAELISVDGRKLKFRISVCDDDGLIGEGEHLRFVVDREKFMGKV